MKNEATLAHSLTQNRIKEINMKQTKTRNATRFNNRDDLLHVSSFLIISIFSEVYTYKPVEHLCSIDCHYLTGILFLRL